MRWNIIPKKEKEFNIGDKKEIVKFAFFPKKIDKNNKIWLERYVLEYEYKSTYKKKYRNSWLLDDWYDIVKSNDWVLIKKKLY